MDTDLFASNLELWAHSHPKEAVLLPYLSTEGLNPCVTDQGEVNGYWEEEGKRFYLHAQEGAVAEASQWFEKLDLSGINVLYVIGIGMGYYYDQLLPWLRQDLQHSVVFIEDDLRVLSLFFHTERAQHLLQDKQVYLIYVPDENPKNDAINEVYWNFALTKATVSVLESYRENKRMMFESLSHEISYSADLKKALLDEYLCYGAPYFANCYRNLMHLHESYLGDNLFGHFSKIPAIICGAGPSLEKNGSLLRELGNRALIFAGGSAINILNNMGIQPHFCVGIDPNEAQQVRLRSNQAFEVPFFYRQRLNYSAFCTVHAPRLYVTGSGGYDIAEFLEERLGIVGKPFEEGHNVVNFAMELAYQMGCYPLIFVGMDLAFTDRKTYSSGVTFDPAVEQRTLDEYARFETDGLKRKDIFGEPIYTLWKWVAESEWMGEWATDHQDSLMINCTEGGLGFPGVINRSLREVTLEYLKEEFDLLGQIHTEIQSSHLSQVTEERVTQVMKELYGSLERCCHAFDVLNADLERIKAKSSEERCALPRAQSGQAALVELELADEPAWKAVLEIFHVVWARLQNKDLMRINRQPMGDWERGIKRIELSQRRLAFLRDVALANRELIDYALRERESEIEELAKEPHIQIEKLPLISEVLKLEEPLVWPLVSEKNGPWRLYYDSGAVKSELYYVQGKLHGEARHFTEDGILLAISTFQHGLREGDAFYYYASGSLYSRQRFVNNKPDGMQFFYYEDGQPRTTLEYRQGSLINDVLLYAPGGKLKRHLGDSVP